MKLTWTWEIFQFPKSKHQASVLCLRFTTLNSMKVKSQNISEIAADQINFRANKQIRQFILFQILDFSGVEVCK